MGGFIPFSVFVIVGSSNAVNLTDGLDGLATVPVILVACCFAFISYVTGNIVFSDYLQIPYIEGTGEVSIICVFIVLFFYFSCRLEKKNGEREWEEFQI